MYYILSEICYITKNIWQLNVMCVLQIQKKAYISNL